jgi:hypothetical protein
MKALKTVASSGDLLRRRRHPARGPGRALVWLKLTERRREALSSNRKRLTPSTIPRPPRRPAASCPGRRARTADGPASEPTRWEA